MSEQVQEYLKKMREAEQEAEKRKLEAELEERRLYKEKILYNAGLFEKRYCKNGEKVEWIGEEPHYYNYEVLPVTDEEFAEIEKFNKKNVKEDGERTSGDSLKRWATAYLAIWIICCIIASIILFVVDLVGAGIGILLCGIIFSFFPYRLIRGFGELISDTHEIKEKLKEKDDKE